MCAQWILVDCPVYSRNNRHRLQRLQITSLTPSDAPELLSLYQSLYPTLGWSESYLRWQYFENPAGHAQVWVARDAGQIVASYAAVPLRLYIDGHVNIGWRVQDVLTRPEYRGRGLYHELSATAARFLFDSAYPLNVTFPNEHSHKAFIRMGWVQAFQLPLRVCGDTSAVRRQPVAAEVVSINGFDRRAEQVWASHVRRSGLGVDRSVAHLNWRYCSNPKSEYARFHLSLDGSEAILVLKYFQREDGSRWSHLVDLFQSEPGSALTESAFGHWVNVSLEQTCKFMSCWAVSTSPLDPILSRAGFVSPPGFNRWLLVNANADVPYHTEERRWHLAMGDSDVF